MPEVDKVRRMSSNDYLTIFGILRQKAKNSSLVRGMERQLRLIYRDEVTLRRIVDSIYKEQQAYNALAKTITIVSMASVGYVEKVVPLVRLVDRPV